MKMRSCLPFILILATSGGTTLAGPLNPLDYAAYGPLVLTSGTASLNTSGNTPTLTANGITYAGLVVNGVVVFDFNGISIGQGATLTGSGPLPVALLSRSDVAIGGTIELSGSNSNPGPGGGSGANYTSGGPGGGNGAPQQGAGGAGFGGVGGSGSDYRTYDGRIFPGYSGGLTYGNLAVRLQGGSGGGGESGGGGGGGIEIGAVNRITFSQAGLIDAHGGSAGVSCGGGSGGGIFLHASTVLFDPSSTAVELNVAGGDGGNGQVNGGPGGGFGAVGGGGGGGRILIEHSSSMFGLGGGGPIYNLAGGSRGVTASGAGTFSMIAVPEPSSLALLAVGVLGLYARSRVGRRG